MATVTRPSTALPNAKDEMKSAQVREWVNNIIGLIEESTITSRMDKNNVDFSSTDGIVVKDTANTITGLLSMENTSAAAGGARVALRVGHDPGSGTPANGDGPAIQFFSDDVGGNETNIAQIDAVFSDVTDGSEDANIILKTTVNGTTTTAATINPSTFTLPGELDAATLDISGDADIDGIANLDNTDIDGTLAVDGTTISLDATTSLNIDNSNTSNGITIGTATSGVPVSIGHTVSEVTVNDNLTVTGTLTLGSGAELTEAELELLDGITAGVVAANKAVVVDSNKDAASFRNLTLTGELDAATLDISGNADIDGTTNLDAVDIDGAVQLDGTLTIGANDQGYDVILYGDTASANLTWDTSVDDLIWNGAARAVIPDSQLVLGSTAVTTTGAEINLIDGGTSRGTTAVASGDGILINDDGTMRMTNVDTVSTYFSSHNVGGTNIVTVGTIGTGTWQGTAIASAYLDSDTAHLSGTQTFSGAKTFSAAATLATGSTIGNLTLANGSITDSSGAITFVNENLATTGTLAAGVATLATGSTIGNLTLADGSITDSSGSITFVNENLATTGTLSAGVATLATGSTIGNLTFANGSITDSSGAISMGDENLSTTGTLAAGATTIGGTLDFNSSTIDLSTQTVDVTLNAAVDALNFDSNTLSIDATNNRVGIGEASPDTLLHVGNTTLSETSLLIQASTTGNSRLLFGDSSTTVGMIDYDHNAAGAMQFTSGGSVRMTLDQNGLLGLGTAAPSDSESGQLLHVKGEDANVKVEQSSGTGGFFAYNDGSGDSRIKLGVPAGDWALRLDNSDSDSLKTSWRASGGLWAELMTLTTTGNVGIGETAPGALLHLKKNNGSAAIRLEREDTSVSSGNEIGGLIMTGGESSADVPVARIVTYADDTWTSSSSPTRIEFEVTPSGATADVLAMTLDSTGYLGIGTAAPAVPLDVSGSGHTAKIGKAGTAATWLTSYNDENTLHFGVEDSNGEDIAVGSSAYSGIISSGNSGRALELATEGKSRLKINSNGMIDATSDNKVGYYGKRYTYDVLTLIDDADVTISAGNTAAGLLLITEHNSGDNAMYYVGYGSPPVLMQSNGSNWASADTDGKYCVIIDGYATTFKNRVGLPRSFSISLFSAGMH